MAIKDKIKKAKKPFGSPTAEDDGNFSILIPEGAETGKIPARDDYIGQLMTLTKGISQQGKGNPMWTFGFQIVKGKYAGMDFQMYCPLVPNSLWKLADVLAALGVKYTPGKQTNFSRSEVLNTLVRMVIADGKDNRSGRDISQLATVLPHPDGAGKKGKKSGFMKPKVEEEEEEEEEQDEQDEEQDEDEEETTDEEETDEEESEEDEESDEEGDEDEEGEEEDDEEDESEDDEEEESEDEEEYETVKPKRRSGPKVEEREVKPKRKAKKEDGDWPEPPPSPPHRKKGGKVPAKKPVRRGRPR